jgi:hypothetical protein
MLGVLVTDDSRREIVLSAIKGPLSAAETEAVYGFACDALEYLRALDHSRSYWEQFGYPSARQAAMNTSTSAYMLLDAEHRRRLHDLFIEARPDDGPMTLDFIDRRMVEH